MAKKPKRRLTEAQKAERKRITAYDRSLRYRQNFFAELLSKNFVIESPLFKSGVFSPPRPKKITEASINKLRSYNAEWFYKHSQFLNPETGELVTGKEGRKYIRENEWKSSAPIDTILNIEAIINALPDKRYIKGRIEIDLTPYKNKLKAIMWNKFNSYETAAGQKGYAKYIEKNRAELEDCIQKLKDSDQAVVLASYSRASDILNRGPVTPELKKELGKADEV